MILVIFISLYERSLHTQTSRSPTTTRGRKQTFGGWWKGAGGDHLVARDCNAMRCLGFVSWTTSHLSSPQHDKIYNPATTTKPKTCFHRRRHCQNPTLRSFSSRPFTCLMAPETRTASWQDKQQWLSIETPKIQGEWVGYSADYEMDTGKVICVPEKWVPDAFIDWDILVKGLEHMTSATMDGDLLRIKETFILPKVGCEEDAVAADVSDYAIPYKNLAFVPFPGGSFSYGPEHLQQQDNHQQSDIIANMAFFHATKDEQKNHGLTRLGITVSFATQKIHLVKEEWNMEYNGGQSLIGCGGTSISPFDDDERLDPSDLLPFQQGTKITWSRQNPDRLTTEYDTEAAVPWTVGRIEFDWYLPANAHVRCFYGEDNRFCLQTGWLATPNHYFLISREYDPQQQLTRASWFESKVDM